MTETGETKITNIAGLEYAQGPGGGNQISSGKLSPGVIYSGGTLESVEIEFDDGDDTERAR